MDPVHLGTLQRFGPNLTGVFVDVTAEVLHARTRETLPLPGSGGTWERWSVLADVAVEDLSLAKLVEPHHDALAICAELAHQADPDGTWAVWAAEPPFARLTARREGDTWVLQGRKAFCSGATLVTHALITAEAVDGPRLFALEVDQPGVAVAPDAPGWVGPGMRDAATVTLDVGDAVCEPVGPPGAYVRRPGFWHGGIGVAAVWWGGARGVADTLESTPRHDPHSLAHRGAVRTALHVGESVLRESARRIDAVPTASAEALAIATRSAVADVADDVVRHVGRATGPGPLAFDAEHAGRVADLQVFVRQHHAERDLARLGETERP